MSLSSSACPMMLCLRDRLLSLHQLLEVSLFQLTWQGLAERLDHFLYQDVGHGFTFNLCPHDNAITTSCVSGLLTLEVGVVYATWARRTIFV